MKRAILITSFGSTVESARKHNIEPVVEKVKAAHPDMDVFLAFTSRIIIKKLKEQGIEYKNEIDTVKDIVAAGYEELIVQPTHLVGGKEFEKLKRNISLFVGQGSLKRVRFGRPLLTFMGQEEHPDDYEILIEGLLKELAVPEGDGLLLVGHGGVNVGNASYSVLQLKLFRKGLSHVRIASLENFPELDDVALPWEWYDGIKPKTVHLHPLLLVAGDHVLNDLFGDEEDSIKCQLEEAGFEVKSIAKGLGAYEFIQDIYVEHLNDAIEGLYQKSLS